VLFNLPLANKLENFRSELCKKRFCYKTGTNPFSAFVDNLKSGRNKNYDEPL